MSEMIERVGDALRTACRKEYGTDWNYNVAWKFARVAIEAMREPTDEMYDRYRCEKPWKDLNSHEVWRLWIDSALEPKEDNWS